MSYHTGDTICAIGTAAGGSARAMIRVSGPEAVAVTERVFDAAEKRALADVKVPSLVEGFLRLSLGNISSGNPGKRPSGKGDEVRVPSDLFLWPGSRSYTREPMAELHTIGSQPVLQVALDDLCRSGARLAEPGEFTLRAFLAGRIDLTQAEGVLGVIDSCGEEELHIALAQLAGGLAEPLHALRNGLLQLLAELEAGLDFVEEDIRFISQQDILERLQAAYSTLNVLAGQVASRSTMCESPQIVLLGRPNVGKSSLFNALVSRYGRATASKKLPVGALVSDVRGTTRDYLTAAVILGNIPCELVDTAGVEDGEINAAGSIEMQAHDAAAESAQRATVRLLCIDCRTVGSASLIAEVECQSECEIVAFTKADLCELPYVERECEELTKQLGVPVIPTSSRSGIGLANLERHVATLLKSDSDASRSNVLATTAERCRESVRLAMEAVESAMELTMQSSGDELVAAEVRVALGELGKMVGAVYTDDLLDRIFKTFCIGK